jgi:hypothetical protein
MTKITIPHDKFEGFGKIARETQAFGCIMTEKLDGTNAQIVINEDNYIVGVGSRKRWIDPHNDNYGFAAWVEDNYEELVRLGPGTHYGEWYGCGINRGYGLDEKRFALFNTGRFLGDTFQATIPECVSIVPTLHIGDFSRETLNEAMAVLATFGSFAVPGYMKPEGIVSYLFGPRMFIKSTFDAPEGKWKALA